MDFVIICNDGGEMKTITAKELETWAAQDYDEQGRTSIVHLDLDRAMNAILDRRAIDAGEYDPTDNDTPMLFTTGADDA